MSVLQALFGILVFVALAMPFSNWGIGAMCPERRPDLMSLGFRALYAARSLVS